MKIHVELENLARSLEDILFLLTLTVHLSLVFHFTRGFAGELNLTNSRSKIFFLGYTEKRENITT
jgi:hypothetical protein